MGAPAEVQVQGAPRPREAIAAAFDALQRVDDSMSLWKESELTRLNEDGRARVSADLLKVLVASLDVARASDGAFDPTVEPLVRATGGLGGPHRRLSTAERRSLLQRVGFSRVTVDVAASEVTLASGARLDLGGIAKGYAADQALEALRRAGATRALVDLGQSSIGAFGEPLEIAARDPGSVAAPPWGVFKVDEGGVSTSGGDQKPDHILDPRTGQPARGLLAATVVARDGMEADALSTAVYVLGAERGLRLLETRGAAGVVLVRTGGRRALLTTRGFAAAYALVAGAGVEVRER